ncbi:hypothetical protein Taro_006902 [Colocasia esculenta]|uniref:Uncharacterized protein n=1 Tax=Colocasia esculenta TaxID=4460 RepID=A0A843TZ13_COLES|nr:hypothetical protein [Colocasia esculenta]
MPVEFRNPSSDQRLYVGVGVKSEEGVTDVDSGSDAGGTVAQLQAHAQAPAPVPQEHGHGGLSIMERFKRMALPSFKGESQPLLAES